MLETMSFFCCNFSHCIFSGPQDSYKKAHYTDEYTRAMRGFAIYKKFERGVKGLKREGKEKTKRKLQSMIDIEEQEYYDDEEDEYEDDAEEEDYHDEDDADHDDDGDRKDKEEGDNSISEKPVDVTGVNTRLEDDNDDCGSAFGIMRVYCDSEIHTAWY